MYIQTLYIYIYIYKVKVKLATVVEGDPKAPFSLATIRGVREDTTPFPGLLYFTLDTYLIMLNVKQGGIKHHFFESLVWFNLGLNPSLLDHWWTLYPLRQWTGYYIYMYICECAHTNTIYVCESICICIYTYKYRQIILNLLSRILFFHLHRTYCALHTFQILCILQEIYNF